MPMTTQLTLTLQSKPGVLAKVARALADAGVNITALSAGDRGSSGKLRIVVNNPGRAKRALRAAKLRANEEPAFVVRLRNKPGTVARVAEKLARARINIKSAFAATAGRRGFHGREARRHARLSRWRARRLPSLSRRRRARAPPLPAPHRLRPRPVSHPGVPASRPPQGGHHDDRRRLSLRARPPALSGADHARRAAAPQSPRALVLGHGRAERHRRRDRLDRSADRGARPSRESGSRLQRPGRQDDRRAREAPRRDAGDWLRFRVRRGLSAPDRSRLMSNLSAGIARSDVVGSLLRPAYLREVRQRAREGAAGRDEVRAAEDRAVREAIVLQESAGLDVITDGELRRNSWVVTIPLREVAIPDAPLSGFEFLPADPGWWSLWREPDGSRAQAWTSPTRPFITRPL